MMGPRPKLKCPTCGAELPDYFHLGKGALSMVARCAMCNTSVGLSRMQPEPHVVYYNLEEEPRELS
jgi:transcription elongation factor Elf1